MTNSFCCRWIFASAVIIIFIHFWSSKTVGSNSLNSANTVVAICHICDCAASTVTPACRLSYYWMNFLSFGTAHCCAFFLYNRFWLLEYVYHRAHRRDMLYPQSYFEASIILIPAINIRSLYHFCTRISLRTFTNPFTRNYLLSFHSPLRRNKKPNLVIYLAVS